MEEDYSEVLFRDFLLLSMLGVRGPAPPLTWEFLVMRDRMQLTLVSKKIKQNLEEIEYTLCKDGGLYRVPFPGYPGLMQTPAEYLGLFPHQLASLQAMFKAENSETQYGALRGGILGDAPGLGKSITLLALITSTAGKRPKKPPVFWNSARMRAGWMALSQNASHLYVILKALKPFRVLHNYKVLVEQTKPPFSLERFPTVQDFERFVIREVKEDATEAELEIFRQNVLNLKAGLDKSHRKYMKFDAEKRMKWERSLMPTSATLLIVPHALLEHWFQQMYQHLNREMFADANENSEYTSDNLRGVVYLDGVGDLADARMPLGHVNINTMEVPKPSELAKYLVVVTTFTRCEREYQREVLSGGLGRAAGCVVRNSGKRKHFDGDEDGGDIGNSSSPSSSFLQMRWLRLCVDEGHELSQEIGSGLTLFVNQIAAERRWVLSGTPTTGNEDDEKFSAKALDQLQKLLLFLRHPVYGTVPPPTMSHAISYRETSRSTKNASNQKRKTDAKTTWTVEIRDPFLKKDPEGRDKLLQLLKNVMVMHRKEDINLPKPIFRLVGLDVPVPEDVQTKLKLNPDECTDLLQKYLGTDSFQSLVDEAQGRHIVESIRKAQKTLQERGGPLEIDRKTAFEMMSSKPVGDMDGAQPVDRRPIKAVVYSTQKNNLRDVTEYLYKLFDWENIAEAYDDREFDCSSELSRFRNNRKECRTCPICGFQNDISNKRKGSEATCSNIIVEVVSVHNQRVRFLVEAERILRAVPVDQGGNVLNSRLEGNDYNSYGSSRKQWRVGDILEVDTRDPHPVLKKRESGESWLEYGSEKCIQLAAQDGFEGKDWFFGPLPEEEGSMKVRLMKFQNCSRYHSHSRWYRGPRLCEAPVETVRENVFVLALDAGLAHGLDLSFVTHIFLLEPVEDAALLEQITSRAHRLGATGPVNVETVETFYKVYQDTKVILEMSEEQQENKKSKPRKHNFKNSGQKKTSLTTAVCQYCYRHFDSIESAESHEAKQCPRNPVNIDTVDPWHLSSVYREIQPPAPRLAHR